MTERRYEPNPDWAEHIRQVVADAPKLTAEQVDTIAALFDMGNKPTRVTRDTPRGVIDVESPLT